MAGNPQTQNVTQVSFSKFVEHMKKFFSQVEVVGDRIVEISVDDYDSMQLTTASVFNSAVIIFLTPTRWVKFVPKDSELIYSFDNVAYFSAKIVSFVLDQKKSSLKISVVFPRPTAY